MSTYREARDAEAALNAIAAAIGADRVTRDAAARAAIGRATHDGVAEPIAVLQPRSVEEVRAIVRCAAAAGLALYPFSRGRNYGYGSRAPRRAGAASLDLSRLNRIRAYDPAGGTLTVEPGVTFADVVARLEAEGGRHVIAGTGSAPDSSVLANVLERGLGKGPTGYRAEHFCDVEAVVGAGELIYTGPRRHGADAIAGVARADFGPDLTGLFTQASLGVVTALTVWLAPRPRVFQPFIYVVNDAARLPGLVDALGDLRQRQVLRSTVSFYNDYRLLAFFAQYPYDRFPDGRALPRAAARDMLRAHTPLSGAWLGDGALFCESRAQARAERALIRRRLGPAVDRLVFVDRVKIAALRALLRLRGRRDAAERLGGYFDRSVFLGWPVENSIASTYFRKRAPAPADPDPDRDGCGLVWLSPIAPLQGAPVAALCETLERIIFDGGFEPALTCHAVSARHMEIVASIAWDRDEAGADARARAVHERMMAACVAAGAPPYRLGTMSHPLVPPEIGDGAAVRARLKAAFDPAGVFAPGGYE